MKQLVFFALSTVFLLPIFVSAEQYYECVVTSDATRGGVCEQFRGYSHMCQLYDGYEGSGIPDHCSSFCVDRSDIPSECADVSVRVSTNPEAHEARAGILDNIPVDNEVLEDIAGELQDKLQGIENEVNTEDGISQEEAAHVIGRVINAIKEILGSKQASDETATDAEQDTQEEKGVMDTVVDWTRKDLFCSDKPRYIQKGEIVSVSGEGSAWIERGLKVFRASVNAPLMGGDFVRVPEGMTVELHLYNTGTLKVSQSTRFLVPTPSPQERKDQCVRGAIQNRVTNGVRSGWMWLKGTLQGETFEIMTPTAGGVRG